MKTVQRKAETIHHHREKSKLHFIVSDSSNLINLVDYWCSSYAGDAYTQNAAIPSNCIANPHKNLCKLYIFIDQTSFGFKNLALIQQCRVHLSLMNLYVDICCVHGSVLWIYAVCMAVFCAMCRSCYIACTYTAA